jgi:hypothetical protein
MTARQIIQEIEALPATEQHEIFVSLQQRLAAATASDSSSKPALYLSPEAAEPLVKEILTEHAELFRKLAQ